MKKVYRKLTREEIDLLEQRGCTAENWQQVEVSDPFIPERLREVSFGGKVWLGSNDGSLSEGGLRERPCGISRAALYDCRVGDSVLIANVGRYIANYDIEAGVVIENVGEIYCEGESSFGNGTPISVINEGGGREVRMYEGLTAQVAYILALYRQRNRTIERLEAMIAEKTRTQTSSRGRIGAHSRIVNTLSLVNVLVGEYATVDGAQQLREGSIGSSQASPSRIGCGVTARHFILSRSASVETGSQLRHCFVGEGSLIENGFSGEHSLFFANCHCSHGEACSVFAGPYTVSHHRASLLIAGYFSFFNAGSGANQSNHLYKTGPVHQGIHLRGCKFGSDAYVLLPACTGVFTLVSGRHYNHHDTDHMPFSYLVEQADESLLIPGVTLRSIGTARDTDKWPRRDRRQGVESDRIHYAMMNPYTAGKILKAIKICEFLLAKYPGAEAVTWNRVRIETPALRKGLLLYTQALRSYLSRLFAEEETTAVETTSSEPGEWVDLAGMFLPREELSALLEAIDREEITSLEALGERLDILYGSFAAFEQHWAGEALAELLGKPAPQITPDDVREVVRQGKKDHALLEKAIAQDALRDRALMMAVGYGLDFDQEREADFRAVRGN